jgi:hypothetical protein
MTSNKYALFDHATLSPLKDELSQDSAYETANDSSYDESPLFSTPAPETLQELSEMLALEMGSVCAVQSMPLYPQPRLVWKRKGCNILIVVQSYDSVLG